MAEEEPTVLDYIKSKLRFWEAPAAPTAAEQLEAGATPEVEQLPPVEEAAPLEVTPPPPPPRPARPFPWRTLLAFGLGLLAQLTLEPHREWIAGLVIYALAFGWLVVANWKGEWRPALAPEVHVATQRLSIRWSFLMLGLVFSGITYIAFGSYLFTKFNVIVWALALGSLCWAFWAYTPGGLRQLWERVWGWIKHPHLSLGPWAFLLIVVALVAIYFRVRLINEVPSQMNSDHAEKLLDVWDVLHGYTRVFFPRNTGREAFQFHLIAATIMIFKTGFSFLSMKIGAIAGGLLTLPYIYLIGKEIGNRWVGMWAALYAGIAYWPNVFSRLALRFTFYPFFAAPALFFLIRGLRRQNRNDFILAGLLLGLGLHSYTPIRILPLVVVVGVGLYMLHQFNAPAKDKNLAPGEQPRATFFRLQTQTIYGLAIVTVLAVAGFIPLLRYIASPVNREIFFYRSLTRVGTIEQPLSGPAWKIFISNTWNAMRMFGWDGGDVWTVSIPHRPALDTITAVLFYLGMGLLLLRYIRKRNWIDLFLPLSVPMLMLPSILSLAFPNENPVLSRVSGAIIPVFVIVGIALDSLLSTIIGAGEGEGGRVRQQSWRNHSPLNRPYRSRSYGIYLAVGLGAVLFLLAANANYDLVFNQYRKEYDLSAWNTSEMGAVYHDFATSIGTRDTFWLVGYPYWVDSRLISIIAGYPDHDCAILPPNLASTSADKRAKLFLLHPEDSASLTTLQQLYPQGTLQEYQSKYATKNFLMFFVPPSQ